MTPPRQQGGILLMVPLLVLAAGSIMLQGGGQVLGNQATRLHSERQMLIWQQQAHNALAWGQQVSWVPGERWQCRELPGEPGQACLLQVAPGDVLLAGRGAAVGEGAQMVFWQRGRVIRGQVVFLPRGWSDFCPLGAERCRLP
ncbi:Protein of uncharacterised function (DUF2509) [Shimwellia blattae]|nr:YgdB family protein [Shimwellia blattae]VEC21268.1 Protein of uncharacterised function (DUF2509) [Shimwellia blattae]